MPIDPSAVADSPTVTRDELREALAQLGVRPGDVILTHSSLKSLGVMDGGADGVVDAMLAAVGPNGHAAVPTHTYCYVTAHRVSPPYDKAASPSRVGAITETFRLRAGPSRRSDHPTHSIAAMGPAAELLVSNHRPGGGTCAIDGPHGRYVRWGAKILFIGCGLSANTTYHAVEDWLALPYMPDGQAAVANPAGGEPILVPVNRPSGHRNFYRNEGQSIPNPVTDALSARGLIRKVMLNQTALLLVHSRDVIRVTIECELASPAALLCAQDGCGFCELGRSWCVRQRERIIARGQELLARAELCDPRAPEDRSK